MQSLLAPIFLLLVFLLPPYLMVAAVIRNRRRLGWAAKSPGLAAATVAAMLFAAVNTLFVLAHLPSIAAGRLETNWVFVTVLLVSWASICGRLAVRTLWRWRRRSV